MRKRLLTAARGTKCLSSPRLGSSASTVGESVMRSYPRLQGTICLFATFLVSCGGPDKNKPPPPARLEIRLAVSSDDLSEADIASLRTALAEGVLTSPDHDQMRWFPILDLEAWLGLGAIDKAESVPDPASVSARLGVVAGKDATWWYLLLRTDEASIIANSVESPWAVKSAYLTQDNLGRWAIGFELDDKRAKELAKLTDDSVGKSLGILIDGVVYCAPGIQGRIGKNGIIVGDFDLPELQETIHRLTKPPTLQSGPG